MKTINTLWAVGLMMTVLSTPAGAQTGVSDDRVSLPEGPGSLEGVGENVDIDPNMGVMRYGIPIQVPQGFAGLTPELQLAYSSGNGGSVVGMGWSMEVPTIERMTYRGLPQYNADDDFCVSGSNQIILLPGSDPPTYRARYEKEFVRYRWYAVGDGSQGYWTAEYPDGRTGYFGADQEGNLVPSARVSGNAGTFRYHLVEMTDVYGHTARYRYTTSGVIALLRSIDYVFTGGRDANDPRYSVSFQYEERMDNTGFDYLSDAKAGFNELLTQRLAHINVFSGAERIRRYNLTYEPYDDSGGFTRLTRVELEGLDGSIYPAVFTFAYSQALGGICDGVDCARPFMLDMGNIGFNVGVGRATLLDINGDALPDLLNTSDDGPHTFLLNVPTTDGTARFAPDDPVTSAVPEAIGSSFRLGTQFVQVLDVNGDGFTDLLHAQTGEMLINRGNGDWERVMNSDTNAIADVIDEGQTFKFLDYNNDKRIDVLRSTRSTTSIYRNFG
ncbi:MAG: SpvB/TcaC N-terminal domain-containing protein, partial [Myxococcota bacterium]